MDRIFSTGEVARLLRLRPYQIEYSHSSQSLAEPRLRFLGKRVYTLSDVNRVAEHFGIQLDVNNISLNTVKEEQ